MKKKCMDSARVKRAQFHTLRKYFETLAMKEREFVPNYFSRAKEVSNKMRFYDKKMHDVTIVEKILHSLRPNSITSSAQLKRILIRSALTNCRILYCFINK